MNFNQFNELNFLTNQYIINFSMFLKINTETNLTCGATPRHMIHSYRYIH
jgi:hypothetical protein